ncbi:MAG: acyltransferase [Rikenellaceae bacterium]
MEILKKDTYDPFIDYVKGLSIICVVLTHNLPLIVRKFSLFEFWGKQAVPIFLLMQVFHTVRYFSNGSHTLRDYFDFGKLFKRIIFPFALLILAQLLCYFMTGDLTLKMLKYFILHGGIGPGSYYVWIYIQFWILTPFIVLLFRKFRDKIGGQLALICVVISIIFEILCSYINLPLPIYRLLFIRYFFLIYLGIYLYYGNNKISIWQQLLGGLGLIFLMVQAYFQINLEPFIFSTDYEWRVAHFPTYFYVVFLLLPLIKKYYIASNLIEKIGRYSYDIFLVQMFVFTFWPKVNILHSIDNQYIYTFLNVIVTTALSIMPVLCYKRLRS